MSRPTQIIASVVLSIWLFVAFHFGWEKLYTLLPPSIIEHANIVRDYIMFWLLGVGLGGIWLMDKKNMLSICLIPILFLMFYGLFLKGIQWIFGYGEIHKTLRQVLSLFRTPGFLMLFFFWIYLKKKITSPPQ